MTVYSKSESMKSESSNCGPKRANGVISVRRPAGSRPRKKKKKKKKRKKKKKTQEEPMF